jgi:hypothetical protein
MASIFDKWNKSIDVEGLKKDVEEADKGGQQGEYREVPVGTYECKIEKLELKESSKGQPMVSAWFRILNGDYENNLLFMNQVITQGFQISIVNRFLKSLEAVDDDQIEFKDYGQYNDLLMDIMEAVDGQLEFLIEYKKSKKDFAVYTVKEVYDVNS